MDQQLKMAEHEIIKIITIGHTNVGKTALIQRYIENTFDLEGVCSVIAVSAYLKQLIIKKHLITLQIYDTSGQERYKAIPKSMYKTMNGILIAFAIDNYDSFTRALQWHDLIKKDSKKETCFLFLGCKSDLESQRKVSTYEAEKYASDNNIPYIETSAKDNTNVEKVFEKICEMVLSNPIVVYSLPHTKLNSTLSINKTNASQNNCCE